MTLSESFIDGVIDGIRRWKILFSIFGWVSICFGAVAIAMVAVWPRDVLVLVVYGIARILTGLGLLWLGQRSWKTKPD